MEESVKLINRESIPQKGIGEQEHQILDPEHEASVCAVGSVVLQGGKYFTRGKRPHLVQVASSNEAVTSIQNMILAHKKADNSMEKDPVAINWFMHVGRGL